MTNRTPEQVSALCNFNFNCSPFIWQKHKAKKIIPLSNEVLPDSMPPLGQILDERAARLN